MLSLFYVHQPFPSAIHISPATVIISSFVNFIIANGAIGRSTLQIMSVNGDGVAEVTQQMSKAELQKAESTQRSREAGWVEPEKYDYDAYNAGNNEARQAVDGTLELPTWAANATKYEWKDEYGEVGPAHPELEEMLFGKDFHVTEGKNREKYVNLPISLQFSCLQRSGCKRSR